MARRRNNGPNRKNRNTDTTSSRFHFDDEMTEQNFEISEGLGNEKKNKKNRDYQGDQQFEAADELGNRDNNQRRKKEDDNW